MTFTIAQNYWIFTFLQMMQIYSLMESEINSELANVHIWLSANKLLLNIEKSNFAIFHPVQKRIPKQVILFINNQSLTEKNCIRYLGVYIDSYISWKSHMNYIAKKIKRSIGILSKLRYLLITKTLLSLYYTAVL